MRSHLRLNKLPTHGNTNAGPCAARVAGQWRGGIDDARFREHLHHTALHKRRESHADIRLREQHQDLETLFCSNARVKFKTERGRHVQIALVQLAAASSSMA